MCLELQILISFWYKNLLQILYDHLHCYLNSKYSKQYNTKREISKLRTLELEVIQIPLQIIVVRIIEKIIILLLYPEKKKF